MISLGQASNYSAKRVFAHLFAWGSRKDSERLQGSLAARYHVKSDQVALYHSGRSALTVAIQEVANHQSIPVIIPGLTCIAVVRAVRAAGCEPVFVDIRPSDLAYNYEQLERTLRTIIDKNTNLCYNRSIILVQNTLGITWDVSKIQKIAQKYHASIVEDLAHSAGRFYANGAEVGTVGEAAALSFGKGKAIDTISGGAVILRGSSPRQPTQKPKLSDRLRDRWYPLFGMIARNFGKLGQCFMAGLVKIHFVQRSADAELNINRRLTHWQAKLALKQFQNLPTHPLREYCLVENRDQALAELKANRYDFSEIWYDTPVSPKRYAREADFPNETCPETVKISGQILNFPTWYPPEKIKHAYEIVKKYEVK